MVMTGAAALPMVDVQRLRGELEQRGVRFLLASFVGMSGISKAKLVPITHLADVAQHGAGFAGFAIGGIGQGPHSPDLIGDPRSRLAPGAPAAPRRGLGGRQPAHWGRTLAVLPTWHTGATDRARAAALGYAFKIGVEPEFFLVRRDAEGRVTLADRLDTLEKPCYD